MVLEASAKTDTGNVLPLFRREFREIGLDPDGNQRMGSWEIREIFDLALQPGKTVIEKFVAELPAGTKSAEITVRLSMWPAPGRELEVARQTRSIVFE